MSSVVKDIVAVAKAHLRAADEKQISFGEWSVRQAAKPYWEALSQLDPKDPERFLAGADRALALCLGALVGQGATSSSLVNDPVASITLSSEADGARTVLRELITIYARYERGLSGGAMAAVLTRAERRAAHVQRVQDQDLNAARA